MPSHYWVTPTPMVSCLDTSVFGNSNKLLVMMTDGVSNGLSEDQVCVLINKHHDSLPELSKAMIKTSTKLCCQLYYLNTINNHLVGTQERRVVGSDR